MDFDKLGAILRLTRIERIREMPSCHRAELLISLWKYWEDATAESKDIDTDCAQRVAQAAYHEAMTDAARACSRRAEEHADSATRCATACDYHEAGKHAAKAEEANRCALIIRQLLEKNCGL
jgi:hypothetical protein